ncbi:MAG: hypothetical protein AAGA30_21085, partial [Planctomycetota bacterium]
LGYSLRRRLDIWPAIHEFAKREIERLKMVDGHHVGHFLKASGVKLNTSEVERDWARYLLLEEAAAVFNSINPQEKQMRGAARAVLSRLYSPALSVNQQNYLYGVIDEPTDQLLRLSATDIVNLPRLLKQIEKMEWYDGGANRYHLNDTYQSLLWSEDDAARSLAQVIESHYRNANFRVSVSEELLNRMIPQRPETREPYRDQFLGANVVGQNRISNQIQISLIPDADQISMKLETFGNVKSRTTATRSGIVVENEGNSRFRIIKRLAFGQQGIFADRPETTSQTAQRVIGLRSSLDKIPPLGWVARKIAQNKIREQAPATQRYTQNQVETQAEERFEKEVEQILAELDRNLNENLLNPLIAMDLEPSPVQTSTTEDRVIMRYRLGGRDQMAGNTARPRAISSSLMSMQVHDSAINNVIQRFDLAGKKFKTEELVHYINGALGADFVQHDERRKKRSAQFEFATFDPFRIDFENQQISLSFNLRSFQI